MPQVVTTHRNTGLQMLTEAELKQILTQPKNALCKQYKHLLGATNTDFRITSEALREVAAAACKRNSGARGLRSILELLLRDAMYEVSAAVASCPSLHWPWVLVSQVMAYCAEPRA